ncbi:hypothetical protein MHBO_001096 [Bonamia ostreae]|uniref:Kringle domain-containing protein n=1 Tax=Bonamia ostreae TaxID=126728 RepID=A0ABV2AJ13_9EUKA
MDIFLIFLIFGMMRPFQARPQYTLKDFDSFPYMYGQPDSASKAFQTCQRYRKRLCHKPELERYYKTGRYGCKHFWAYHPDLSMVLSTAILNKNNKCLKTFDYTGIVPMFQHVYYSGYVYYCAIERGPYDGLDLYLPICKDCEGTGKEYKGTLSKTAKGYKCQNWDKLYPQKHTFKLAAFDQNFCRNPDERSKPFCLVDDDKAKEKWDYCDLNCKPYGNFDYCKISFFSEKYFRGKRCDFSVGRAEFKLFSIDGKNCLHNVVVKSIELKGQFCIGHISNYAQMVKNKAIENFRPTVLKGFVLYDTSAQVLLKRYNSFFDYINNHDQYYTLCTPAQVDEAANEIKDESKDRVGRTNVFTKHGKLFMEYSYGMQSSSKLKGSWCCENKNITIPRRIVSIDKAEKECESQSYKTTFLVRGKEITYNIRKRMATFAELQVNVVEYGLELNTFCLVKLSEYPRHIIATNGKVHFVRNTGQVCCVDKDCFPLNYPCSIDSDCCTLKCVNALCFDENAPQDDRNSGKLEGKIPAWLRTLIFFGFLFAFSCCIRCCCPERRLISGSTIPHDE